ncbi:AAC(3) family N-acetyltransferase [Motilimonas pumila]|uniref:Aminoglycoside N(3)-acetyltransferase n=1 Tax=Motilimonas pumila TaxID=2303987 RepID=A0A418YGR9_9GAMM|nr:AAC(3) family N-acetyltransferase [Motilimonas pumila]RJG49013.1 hypothetical protein D1Z90_06490 [Motilimonas pumila]
MRRFHYQQSDIVNSLLEVGVEPGDVVFSHMSLLELGLLKELGQGQDMVACFVDAIQQVIGSRGSFITPTFSYSFCNQQAFSRQHTPSSVGAFSEQFRQQPNVIRSLDPLFSVAGFGPHIPLLFANLPHSSFGQDCLYERLLSLPTKVCNFGVDLFYFTPIHYLERKLQVPYRFDKMFHGKLEQQDVAWQYYVRALCKNSEPNCRRLADLALQKKIAKQHPLGLGAVSCVPLTPYFELATEKVKQDAWYLAQGPQLSNNELTPLMS